MCHYVTNRTKTCIKKKSTRFCILLKILEPTGIQRRSSHGVVVKLPNPRDKGYQQRCIKKLMEFLIENSYPHQVSTKNLMSPSSNDFIRVFQFIYQFIIPNVAIGKKYEEEVPNIFRSLGYPVTISKSFMFSVGTPHTWPILLQALTWLTEIVQLALLFEIDEIMLLDSDPTSSLAGEVVASDRALQYDYMTTGYNEFLLGKDDYPELQEHLQQELDRRWKSVREKISSIETHIEHQMEELSILENDPLSVDNLQKKQAILIEDRNKFKKYIQDLQLHNSRLVRLEQKQVEEKQTLESETRSLEELSKDLKARISEQKLSASAAEKIKMAIKEKQSLCNVLQKELDEGNEELWNSELKLTKRRDKYEEAYRLYLSHVKKVLPSTSENESIENYELCINKNLISQKRKVVKPKISQVKREFSDKIRRCNSKRVTEEANVEEVLRSLANTQDRYEGLEAEITSIKEKTQAEKVDFRDRKKGLKDKVTDIDNEILQDRNCESKCDRIRREIELLKKEQERVNQEIIISTGDMDREICKVAEVVAKHKSYMKSLADNCSNEVTKIIKKRLNSLTECKEEIDHLVLEQ
ncbi:uncharacterized protein TRIADDRAFT_53609 [Trichoplax adhaerens]|uniref:Kinetochore protein NDC80 n=1 Tax=Trichoplax adhaerens TaxID=10228 RepID=B3RPP1_TRIAD|nr:hypothetical protein TRIADDRAFT_53609 [Trichoplax adhaerens]EDV27669.1 hypothetical protein TRIADDRAFT_53609 [Trichoplax adhaerens]|eukprot:XP_002109503.1 hypothetical protein TRIADDRAFT_53609 [Trichoplax adhaerens]